MDFQTSFSDDLRFLLVCCAFHVTYFQLFRAFLPSIAKDRKRLAWIVTFVTATTVASMSPFYTWTEMRTIFSAPTVSLEWQGSLFGSSINNHGHHLFTAHSNNQETFRQDNHQNMDNSRRIIVTMDPSLLGTQKMTERPISQEDAKDNMTGEVDGTTTEEDERYVEPARPLRLFFDLNSTPRGSVGTHKLVVFFTSYLFMDLILGLFYYREQLTLVAGWIHHIVYIGVCYIVVTQNETFMFALYMPMEVPTVVLGVGCLDKSLRRDKFHGAMLFFFRIVYGFSITYEILWNLERPVSVTFKIILVFTSFMNLKFLQGWISQQKRLSRRRMAELAAKASASDVKETGTSITTTTTTTTSRGGRIVSIVAPAREIGSITFRKSLHIEREQHRSPVSRDEAGRS
ncbi:hypothetical protein BGX33_003023 [Mortierella sp. NVP41]|nr:hypothetical protein BGX33_003023 [Mortierella sp. NVP41]